MRLIAIDEFEKKTLSHLPIDFHCDFTWIVFFLYVIYANHRILSVLNCKVILTFRIFSHCSRVALAFFAQLYWDLYYALLLQAASKEIERRKEVLNDFEWARKKGHTHHTHWVLTIYLSKTRLNKSRSNELDESSGRNHFTIEFLSVNSLVFLIDRKKKEL